MSAGSAVAPLSHALGQKVIMKKVIKDNMKPNLRVNSVAMVFLVGNTAIKTCHQFLEKLIPCKHYPLSLLRMESGRGRSGWRK